jgi:hypothetical protein
VAETTAWVLDFDGDLRAAVGEREMVHVIQSPVLFDVPQSPSYCRYVLIWQDTILPVMDLAAWLREQPGRQVCPVAGVFAYQTRPGRDIQYGALALATTPVRTRVNDTQGCVLPTQPDWQALAISCFIEGEHSVPILDVPTIFSSTLSRSGAG